MAYSNVGIANLALYRVGNKDPIANLSENTTVNNIFQYVRDILLEAADWTWAKQRVALAQSETDPATRFSFAYPLPADFMRVAKDVSYDRAIYPSGASSVSYDNQIMSWPGTSYAYVFETLSDGVECIFTDYDNTSYDLYLIYIKRVTDPAKYTARFIEAFADKLGSELAIPIAESRAKKKDLLEDYEKRSLPAAIALNQSSNYLLNELGSTEWVDAGRME